MRRGFDCSPVSDNFSIFKRDFLLPSKFVFLLALAIGLLAFGFVVSRGLDKNWDLLNYHFFTGYFLLNGHFLSDIAPAGLQSFLNPVPNTLAYWALSQLSFPFSGLAIAAVQLTSLPILVLLARQIGASLGEKPHGRRELLAFGLCLLAPLWWSELGTSFTDATTTPLVLFGLYLGLQGMAKVPRVSGGLLVSGIFFGLAVGLKLTHAPFAVGFGMALSVVAARVGLRSWVNKTVRFSVGILLGFVVMGWWNIYLYQHWGSPLFPFYNAWFKSPYFDPTNFRDYRWHFESALAFGQFLWAAIASSGKTSEIAFADARLLLFTALACIVFVKKRAPKPLDPVALVFLVFLGASFFLWTVLFAYQRYLIPAEVLFGFGIWILLTRLFTNPKWVDLSLAACVVASGALLQVPDWGHFQAKAGQKNHFDVVLPAATVNTPAQYLVLGNPISYILPYLHPDSVFFGAGLSKPLDAAIRSRVQSRPALALRVLIRQEAHPAMWAVLEPLGFKPDSTRLSCVHFSTLIDHYIVCDVHPALGDAPILREPIAIDLQGQQPLPDEVLGMVGLSHREPWGRWSDGDVLTVQFANCLPRGRFLVDVRGHAFGPNINKPVKLTVGKQHTWLTLGAETRDVRAFVDNTDTCLKSLSLYIPQKTSPLELGLSTDPRLLGIGLVQLGIQQVE